MKILKKVKGFTYFLLFLSLFFSLGNKVEATPEAEGWEEVPGDFNPVMYVDSENYRLGYHFGMVDEVNGRRDETDFGFNNVFIEGEEGYDKRVDHIFGYSNLDYEESSWYNRTTSSPFLLAIYRDGESRPPSVYYNDFRAYNVQSGYNVYSLYQRNTNVVNKDGTYAKELKYKTTRKILYPDSTRYDIEYEHTITPLSNNIIRMKYTITNVNKYVDKPITFVGMKNVDTDLADDDNVPVYMLGYNQGLYIESSTKKDYDGKIPENRQPMDGRFRLNYIMNDKDGPSNFASSYIQYRNGIYGSKSKYESVGLNHELIFKNYYDPYDGNVLGSGDEARGYLPNQIVPPAPGAKPNDTGIYMKWPKVTLNKGESKDFVYDISLSADLGTEYYFKNLSRSTETYHPKDDVYFVASGIWNTDEIKIDHGTIETSISEYIDLDDETIVDVVTQDKNTENNEDLVTIKSVKMKDVYDKDRHRISVPITEEDATLFDTKTDWVGIAFKGTIKDNAGDQDIIQTSNVEFKSSHFPETLKRQQTIRFHVEDTDEPGEIEKRPNLSISKEADKEEVFREEIINYEVKAQNNNNSTNTVVPLKEAKVLIELDKSMSAPLNVKVDGQNIQEDREAGKLSYQWDENNHLLTVFLDELDVNQERVITYQSSVLSGENGEYKTNSATLTGANTFGGSVQASATVRLKDEKKWTVTFESNGGTLVDSQQVIDNQKATEPANPDYEIREFKGWYEDKGLERKYDFNQPVNEDITLYARWRSPIVNPLNGVEAVQPVEPENKTNKDLRIQYVSDFDFGKHKNGKDELIVNSLGDQIIKENNKKETVPSFVSIIDDRPNHLRADWQLEISSSPFKTENGAELKNSSFNLSNIHYQGVEDGPIIGNDSLTLSGEPQIITESSKGLKGYSWSMAFGNLIDNNQKVSGVTLGMPYGSYKENKAYQAEINWKLTPKLKE